MRKLLTLLGVVLLLAACSSNEESEALKPLDLVKFKPTIKLKKVWTSGAGEGQDYRYTQFVPDMLDDTIYVADTEGTVFAYSAEKGKRLWKKKLKAPVSGAISAAAGKVFVGTYDAEVIALNAADGDELWRATTSSEVLAPPVSNGTIVAASTIDGRLFAFDAATGNLLWTHDHPVPVLTYRTTAAPVLTDNQVIAAFDNGQIISLNAGDGSLGWEVRVSQPKGRTDLERIVDIDGMPILNGAFVYAAAYQGSVVAIARGTGRVLWSQDASTYLRLAVGGGNVYVVTEDDSVIAYNAATGSVTWKNEQLLRRNLSAPAVIGDYVAAIDEEGYMHVLSQSDGSFAVRLNPPGNKFRSPLVSFQDTLYVLSDNGKLSAYRIAPKK